MSAKQILAVLALVLVQFAPAQAANGSLPVQVKKFSAHKPSYTIELAYPHTGQQAIDGEIEAWARGLAKDFADAVAQEETPPAGPWSAELTYEVARNDGRMFSVLFSYYSYMGGAHPNTVFEAFNFLRPDGLRIELPELFTPRGVERISALAIAQLRKTLTGPDGMSDTDWIGRGAGPNAKNFRNFILLANELVIHFDPYQVAAYAAGPQEARIALAKLKDAMRGDPRAPAASFDCALARSDVERTICGNRDLARLDRHVAEDYFEKLAWESDQAKRARLRQEQRSWLKARDASCQRAGQPMVACLMSLYQDRLRALGRAG